MHVDQYYYNPPATAPYSGFSEIDIKPGYQQLHGRDALAFSRYRHTDEDFHREARQQTFLRAFETRASTRFNGVSITDIPDIKNLLDTIKGSDGKPRFTIIGPGGHAVSVSDLIGFIATAYGVRGHIASIHAPFESVTETGGASAVQIDPTALKEALYKWKHPWLVATAGSSVPGKKPTKPATPKWTPAVSPATVQVAVLNGNGVTGDAGKATKQLKGWAYLAHAGGNAPNYNYPQVGRLLPARQPGGRGRRRPHRRRCRRPNRCHRRSRASPSRWCSCWASRTRTSSRSSRPSRPASRAATAPRPPSPTTGEYRDYFKQAEHQVHFRTLYPTVSQSGSEFCPYSTSPPGAGLCSYLGPNPIRTYNLPAAGKGLNSMYAMYKLTRPTASTGASRRRSSSMRRSSRTPTRAAAWTGASTCSSSTAPTSRRSAS